MTITILTTILIYLLFLVLPRPTFPARLRGYQSHPRSRPPLSALLRLHPPSSDVRGRHDPRRQDRSRPWLGFRARVRRLRCVAGLGERALSCKVAERAHAGRVNSMMWHDFKCSVCCIYMMYKISSEMSQTNVHRGPPITTVSNLGFLFATTPL